MVPITEEIASMADREAQAGPMKDIRQHMGVIGRVPLHMERVPLCTSIVHSTPHRSDKAVVEVGVGRGEHRLMISVIMSDEIIEVKQLKLLIAKRKVTRGSPRDPHLVHTSKVEEAKTRKTREETSMACLDSRRRAIALSSHSTISPQNSRTQATGDGTQRTNTIQALIKMTRR